MSGSYDGTVKLSDIQIGKEIGSISIFPDLGNRAAISGAAFVNRNKLLVTSSDTVMRLIGIFYMQEGRRGGGEEGRRGGGEEE